jgi:hypothetical protein
MEIPWSQRLQGRFFFGFVFNGLNRRDHSTIRDACSEGQLGLSYLGRDRTQPNTTATGITQTDIKKKSASHQPKVNIRILVRPITMR